MPHHNHYKIQHGLQQDLLHGFVPGSFLTTTTKKCNMNCDMNCNIVGNMGCYIFFLDMHHFPHSTLKSSIQVCKLVSGDLRNGRLRLFHFLSLYLR